MNADDFKHTDAALRIYDLGAPKRQALWDSVECNDDVYNIEKIESDAQRKVQLAFFEDTKTFNSLRNCERTDIDFMRKTFASHKIRFNEFLKKSINGRLPIRYAVIELGYRMVGAGRIKGEALANAEACSPGITTKIVEDAGDCLADGEIFVAPIENDFFDDYFGSDFEKIGENWYFKTDSFDECADAADLLNAEEDRGKFD